MKQYETITEMAEAYRIELNKGISQECNKWHTAKSIAEVCVGRKDGMSMRYRYGIESMADVIDGFGYVLA